MLSYLATPPPAPPLNIPSSFSTVTLRIINSTTTLHIDPSIFWRPVLQGFKTIHAPIFCFLISHGSQHVLFDLSVRRDWENYSPSTVPLNKGTITVRTSLDISQILDASPSCPDISSASISAIICFHSHFDYIGDPSIFPPTTTLVVGPDFRSSTTCCYPTDPTSSLLDSDFADRPLREIDFNSTEFRIGQFPAFDYFGDGSLYLLHAPGHHPSHICALARTTPSSSSTGSSFILMGADSCHHVGLLRPSPYLPLPTTIFPSPLSRFAALGLSCPGEALQALRPQKSATEPFF
ncbi:MAG: hypothetical protein MMC33_000748 [Icmadophila ericetorum]|nr:hypothetical protein [Icmadophila ericetorum]